MKFLAVLTVGVLIAFVAAAPAAEGECKDMCGTRSVYNGKIISTNYVIQIVGRYSSLKNCHNK